MISDPSISTAGLKALILSHDYLCTLHSLLPTIYWSVSLSHSHSHSRALLWRPKAEVIQPDRKSCFSSILPPVSPSNCHSLPRLLFASVLNQNHREEFFFLFSLACVRLSLFIFLFFWVLAHVCFVVLVARCVSVTLWDTRIVSVYHSWFVYTKNLQNRETEKSIPNIWKNCQWTHQSELNQVFLNPKSNTKESKSKSIYMNLYTINHNPHEISKKKNQ